MRPTFLHANPDVRPDRNVGMRVREIVAALCLVAMPAFAASNLVVNGDFELNGGPGTNKLTAWVIADQAGSSGSWYAQTGAFPMPPTERCSNESVAAPPSGFAAMSNQSFKGSHVMYQDIALPALATKITLTYDLFIYTHGGFANQPTLDFNILPNTQFRADVVDPAAPVADMGSGVLMNVYQSKPGDLRYAPYAMQTADLTQFAGRTIRLRFAQVDNVDCFNAGLDNVSITVEACPAAAPSQLAIAHQCNLGCESGVPISFFATSQSYVPQACDSFAWDFGDGSSSASANPAHTFAHPGTYAVNLTVTNALGSTSAQTNLTIASPPPRQRTIRH